MWNPKKVRKPKIRSGGNKSTPRQKMAQQRALNNSKTQLAKSSTDMYQAKTQANQARSEYGKTTRWGRFKNAITKPFKNLSETMDAKHKAKIAKIDAKAELAKAKPDIYKEQVQTENELKKTKAKYRGKAVGYAAIAKGASDLGKGLSDEGNQDDALSQAWQAKNLETIFGKNESKKTEDGEGYGLEQGVE